MFVFIYKPSLVIITVLKNAFGIMLLVVLWGLKALGIVLKIFFTGKWNIISTIVCLVMECILVEGGRTFFIRIPGQLMLMILIVGSLYLLGVILYLLGKYP